MTDLSPIASGDAVGPTFDCQDNAAMTCPGDLRLVHLGTILGSLQFLQFDSTGIALLCAVAVIASEALSVEEAAQAIHLPTLSAGLVSLNASHQTSDCRGRLRVAEGCPRADDTE